MADPVVDPNAPVVDPNLNPTDPPEKDWKAEYEKMAKHSRTWETRATESKATADANKAAAEELAQLKASQLSETERLQAERDDAKSKADEANTRAEAAEKASRERVVKATVRELASGLSFHDPSDAVKELADQIQAIELDDNGEFDTAEIEKALDKLAEKKPYLVADTGPRTPRADPSQGPRRTSTAAAEEAEYRQFFPKPKRK